MKAAVVCTSIGDGSFLKPYAAELAGRDATMFVIPDRKTPQALYDACAEARRAGLDLRCPPPEVQEQYLDQLGAREGMFGWNTDHRRNVGYLMAYESGADMVISVDDDNLPDEGWLDGHAIVTRPPACHLAVQGEDGFWNPCSLLSWTTVFWPRGYPYGRRRQPREVRCADEERAVSVNAGLWIGDPDVDAITRLALRPESTGPLDSGACLGAGTWAPVNSQNTAVRREVIPSYYFFRSGRFGDIYQGYLAQACAKAAGHLVRFGVPAVRHERNDHDLLHDLQLELPDILRLDGWLDWLTTAEPGGSSYADAYLSLAWSLGEWAAHQPSREHWLWMSEQMRQWVTLCRRIG